MSGEEQRMVRRVASDAVNDVIVARQRAEIEIPQPPESLRGPNREVSALASLPSRGNFVVLAPGERPYVAERYKHHMARLIVLADRELIMVSGWRRRRFRIPAAGDHNEPIGRVVTKLVSVYVHRRVIGPLNTGHKFVYAIGADSQLLGSIDLSDTWAYPENALAGMCAIAGIEHVVEIFDTPRELVAAYPEWAAPELEFEVNHPRQEAAREWATGFYLFAGLASLFGGIGVAAFLLSPIGFWFRICVAVASIASSVLFAAASSRRRMRRSLSARAPSASGFAGRKRSPDVHGRPTGES